MHAGHTGWFIRFLMVSDAQPHVFVFSRAGCGDACQAKGLNSSPSLPQSETDCQKLDVSIILTCIGDWLDVENSVA